MTTRLLMRRLVVLAAMITVLAALLLASDVSDGSFLFEAGRTWP